MHNLRLLLALSFLIVFFGCVENEIERYDVLISVEPHGSASISPEVYGPLFPGDSLSITIFIDNYRGVCPQMNSKDWMRIKLRFFIHFHLFWQVRHIAERCIELVVLRTKNGDGFFNRFDRSAPLVKRKTICRGNGDR